MRISDWSSDVCSSGSHGVEQGLLLVHAPELPGAERGQPGRHQQRQQPPPGHAAPTAHPHRSRACDNPLMHKRSEEHTSELQSLMRISYAVFCLKKNSTQKNNSTQKTSTNNKSSITRYNK